MTAKNTARPDDDDSLGVLDDAASLDTAGIGILGGTAQVRVAIPTGDEDDLLDDGVIDGEVAADLIIEPAPEPAPEPEVGRIQDGSIDIVIEVPAEERTYEPVSDSEDAVTAEVVLDQDELAERIAAKESADAAEDIIVEQDAVPATPVAKKSAPAGGTKPAAPVKKASAATKAGKTTKTTAAKPATAKKARTTEPVAPRSAEPEPIEDSAPAGPAESAEPSVPESATAEPAAEESVTVQSETAKAEAAKAETIASETETATEDASETGNAEPDAEEPTAAAQPSASAQPAAAPAVGESASAAARTEPARSAVERSRSPWVATVERAAAGGASDPADEEDETVSTEMDAEKASTDTSLAPRTAAAPARSDVELTSKRLGDQLGQASRESADLLTADRLLDPHQVTKPEPEGAWSHFLYTVSGRRINIGDGKKAKARKALTAKIASPLSGGARFVPVLSRKGGVGKTTVTALLGMALADARDDRVIAVDANPDRGTLAERIVRSHTRSVRDLVRIHDEVRGYHDISAIVARDTTRLDVLASDADPRIADAFGDADYRDVADVAAHYYSLVLTDTGTGIVHSVMGATLELADQLVIVSGLSVDEARLASETLTWLETNGYAAQARDAIVVLNQSTPGAPLVRLNELEAHFATRARHVVRMPYDPQIAGGGPIVFTSLQPETRQAARELAALLVEGLRASAA